MLEMRFKSLGDLTDPRTGNRLDRRGVHACTLRAGTKWYGFLGSLAVPQRLLRLVGERDGKSCEAQVDSVRLTHIDQLQPEDYAMQCHPAWRTPEGAERGLIDVYGDSFGRIVTVVCFRVSHTNVIGVGGNTHNVRCPDSEDFRRRC